GRKAKQERHTRLHRMHIRRERSVVSTALTEGAHTTRGGAAHTATQKQSNNKKERSPHTTWIVGPREAQPIFITKTVQLPSALVHIQRTPLHAGLATIAATARIRDNKKQKRGSGVEDRGGAVAVGGGRCSFVIVGEWCCC
ncbi:hypothetical protein TcG_11025, partial [Trypanosoma cruzi]